MKIKYSSKKGIMFYVKDKSLLIEDNSKSSDHAVVVGDDYQGDAFNVKDPGEYEVNGISILAQSSSLDSTLDCVEVVFSGVNILYLKEQFKYSDVVHDNVGDIDVLVMEVQDSKVAENLLNKFDPEYFIPTGEEEKILEVLKKLNIDNYTKENFLQVKQKDLGDEEYTLKTVILNK